jgi:hypothetical protein
MCIYIHELHTYVRAGVDALRLARDSLKNWLAITFDWYLDSWVSVRRHWLMIRMSRSSESLSEVYAEMKSTKSVMISARLNRGGWKKILQSEFRMYAVITLLEKGQLQPLQYTLDHQFVIQASENFLIVWFVRFSALIGSLDPCGRSEGLKFAHHLRDPSMQAILSYCWLRTRYIKQSLLANRYVDTIPTSYSRSHGLRRPGTKYALVHGVQERVAGRALHWQVHIDLRKRKVLRTRV